MADGVWTMTEDGEFILNEPYAEMLTEARLLATNAWVQAMLGYLIEHTDYEAEFLKNELIRRNREPGMEPTEIVEEFVLEALSGDL